MMARKSRASSRGRRSGGLRVRSAKASDLAALNELYRQLHPENYDSYGVTAPAFRRAFARVGRDRDHHLLVAEINGAIAGTLHVLIFRHLGHGLRPVAIVENVVVDERFRSKGVGERLIDAAVVIARGQGCYKLSLTSNIKRVRAHMFYERLGWRRSHAGFTLTLERI